MSRRKFDRPFKIAALTLVLKENFSVKEVCAELDIHANTLYRWLSEYEQYGESAFPGHRSALFNAHYEIRKLEKENNARVRKSSIIGGDKATLRGASWQIWYDTYHKIFSGKRNTRQSQTCGTASS